VLGPVGLRARAGTAGPAASPAKPSHPQPQTHQRRLPAGAVLSRLFPRPLGIMQAGRQDRPATRARAGGSRHRAVPSALSGSVTMPGDHPPGQWPLPSARPPGLRPLRRRRKYAEQFSYPGAAASGRPARPGT